MKIINSITETRPLVVHAPGVTTKTPEWKSVVDSKPQVRKETLSEYVTIMSFFVGKEAMALRDQLEASGIEYKNAATNQRYWINKLKIEYILKEIDSIETDYVLVLDGFDVLLAEDLSDLGYIFELLDADIVFNAHKLNWPPSCTDIEKTSTPFKYLNSGAFIGKKRGIKKFFKFVFENYYEGFINGNILSDQIRIRAAREEYPDKKKIKVDTRCVLFQVLDKGGFTYDGSVITVI